MPTGIHTSAIFLGFLGPFTNSSEVKRKYVCQMCDKPGHNARS
ncbi:8517_t:CDS:2, partial [Gigaspora rosea]